LEDCSKFGNFVITLILIVSFYVVICVTAGKLDIKK
jgi:hypothetical protein